MSTLSLRTADGFSVRLRSLHVSGTYDGHLEGTPESVTTLLREPGERERFQGSGYGPTLVLDPGGPALPHYTLIGDFEALDPARDPNQDASFLNVCWFRDDIDATPAEMAAAALSAVEWRAHAIDGSFF